MHVRSIRVRLEIARMWRDLALLNLAIDSKLRACDLAKFRVDEVCLGARIPDRATLRRIQPDARPDESGFLKAFDINRDCRRS